MLVTTSILSAVVNKAFEDLCGKHQLGKPEPKAFMVEFAIAIDSKVEDGYRNIQVVFWAPSNYVQVWYKERWNIISLLDTEIDEDGEFIPKKGKAYNRGSNLWIKVADHDSCWREGLSRVLEKYEVIAFKGWSLISGKNFSEEPFEHE